MPSPLGHALGGAIVGVALAPWGSWRAPGLVATMTAACRSRIAVVAAAAACLPDADFAWGRHNMETHSLGAAVAAGVLTWFVARRWPAWRGWRAESAGRLALAVTLAWASHVAFDWLGSDDTPPLGVMALWPVSSAFFFADAFVFEAISRRYWLPGFWRHNARAVVTEIGLLVPVLATLVILRRAGDRRSAHAQGQPTARETP